jgi:hypothetical protein
MTKLAMKRIDFTREKFVSHRTSIIPWRLLCLCVLLWPSIGCVLSPKAIDSRKRFIAPELAEANVPAVERGAKRPVLDAVGWVVGIPSKLLLWNRRIDNHNISPETEVAIAKYLSDNELGHVKVRLNQYRPWDDMKRLTKNRTMAWPWRYTVGVVSVLGEGIFPGRIFGGDHFNPYTQTVHLYSDLPVIGFHEGAHAKDFSRRGYPGTYAAAYMLPIVPLYHESVASRDVMDYLSKLGDPQLEQQAYHLLYPAYGTYVGGAIGAVIPAVSFPAYYGSVLAGHAAGRYASSRIPSR